MVVLVFTALGWIGTASAESGPELGELALWVDPTSCRSGEVVSVGLSGGERDTMTIVWSADAGEFADPSAQETSFTCPDVACPGENVVVYAQVFDTEQNTSWIFQDLPVSCVPAKEGADTGDVTEAGCGCRAAPAGGLPALGVSALLGVLVCRRRATRGS